MNPLNTLQRFGPGRALGPVLAAVLLAGVATGCGAQAPAENSDVVQALQSQVLAVTEAAAAQDTAGALKRLDDLSAKTDEAARAGDITFKRHESIVTAINALRTDLTPPPPAAPAVVPAAPEPPAPVAPAPVAPAVPAAPPVIAPAPAAPVQQKPEPSPTRPSHGKGNGHDKGGGDNGG